MAKVMVVLATELAVLPVAYGFWLDVCALPLFEGSLQQRLALLRSAPLTWTLLHWMLGMACLMVTAAFLSVVRGVLRPGGTRSRDIEPQLCIWVLPYKRYSLNMLPCCGVLASGTLHAYQNPISAAAAAFAGQGVLVPASCFV